MKQAIIEDRVYETRIYLTFGTIQELQRWYKKHKLPDDVNEHWQALSERLTRPNGSIDYHMHFENYGFSSIVHETNHTTFNVLNDRGMPCTTDTKEAYAYYQEWLACVCRDHFEKWTKKKSKVKRGTS